MKAFKLANGNIEIVTSILGKERLFLRTFNPPVMKYCGGINDRWKSTGKEYDLKRKDEIIYHYEIMNLLKCKI